MNKDIYVKRGHPWRFTSPRLEAMIVTVILRVITVMVITGNYW